MDRIGHGPHLSPVTRCYTFLFWSPLPLSQQNARPPYPMPTPRHLQAAPFTCLFLATINSFKHVQACPLPVRCSQNYYLVHSASILYPQKKPQGTLYTVIHCYCACQGQANKLERKMKILFNDVIGEGERPRCSSWFTLSVTHVVQGLFLFFPVPGRTVSLSSPAGHCSRWKTKGHQQKWSNWLSKPLATVGAVGALPS